MMERRKEVKTNMPEKTPLVLVEVGMNVFGSHVFLGMQKMTLDLEEVDALETIMREAQEKFQTYHREKQAAKKV